MRDARIHDGDVLVVDRAEEPRHGSIVIASIDNEFTVKQLQLRPYPCLMPLNPAFPCYPSRSAGRRRSRLLTGRYRREVRSLFPTGLRCAGEKAGASFMQYCLRPEIGKVEIAPFAYMRGRTFENAVVILDEAQNVTAAQMKMF
nr:Phosphate starvation-inducible protein psiH [Klebsiella pneumoniae]